MRIVLIVVLALLLVGGLPTWRYSRSWGYGPSSAIAALLLVVIALVLLGRL